MSRIVVDFLYPPIPTRQFDYRATYDGDEPDDDGNMDAGYGKTETEAVADLIRNFPREQQPLPERPND